MSTPGTVNYPASLDDAVSLLEATNGATTTLSAPLTDVATTASVASTALFPSTGAVVFNGIEIVYYTAKTLTSFTGLIRGQDGTAAAAHASGVGAQGRIIARHHTVLSEAIRAAESKLDSHTHAFAAITAKPTTIAGYGIVDAFTQAAADALYSALGHTHTFASLTSKPTTLAGYGIVDAAPLVHTHDDRYFTETESDARFAALVHVHALTDITGLISGGKIATGLLPSIAITDTFVVVSQAAMLALTAETGDIAVRSDQSKTYILKGADPSVLADWELLQTPTDAVLSVNGQTGVVSLTAADVGALAVAATSAAATKLATSRNINGVAFDGTANITVTAAAGTLTGATLAAGVTASSLTSVATIATGVWQGTAIAAAYIGAHTHVAADVTSGLFAAARIATGTPDGTKFLRDDQVWSTISASDATKLPLAGGTMTGPIQFGSFSWTHGLGKPGGTVLGLAIQRAGLAYFSFHASDTWAGILHLSSTNASKGIAWSTDSFDNTASTASIETAIMQTSTGVLEINNGTKGTFRDLNLRSLFSGASTTSQASIRMPHGAAPTSPVDGDVWSTTAGLFIRINGVNKTVTLT